MKENNDKLIKRNNEKLREEKEYAEWKLLNFYKTQKEKTHSELRCIIKSPNPNEEDDELPF